MTLVQYRFIKFHLLPITFKISYATELTWLLAGHTQHTIKLKDE